MAQAVAGKARGDEVSSEPVVAGAQTEDVEFVPAHLFIRLSDLAKRAPAEHPLAPFVDQSFAVMGVDVDRGHAELRRVVSQNDETVGLERGTIDITIGPRIASKLARRARSGSALLVTVVKTKRGYTLA